MTNKYPVSIRDFERIVKIGTNIVFYAILDDRVHFEMPIENAVFISQKFIKSIQKEINNQAPGYETDPIIYYMKTQFANKTYYQFYPTEDDKTKLKNYKLYSKTIIRQIRQTDMDDSVKRIEEDDISVQIFDVNGLYMSSEKVK